MASSRAKDLAKLSVNLPKLTTRVQARAARRALTRALTSARVRVSQRIREELNLKAKVVKEVLFIRKPFGSDDGRLTAELAVIDRKFPMIEYQPKPVRVSTPMGPRTGVSVKIKKQGPRKKVKGGFMAKMPSGHVGVFRRIPGKKMSARGKENKQAIRELFSTRPSDIVKEGSSYLSELQSFAEERFTVEYEREFAFQLDREIKRKLG